MPESTAHLPHASLIVLNWNGRELLARCLPSVLAQDYPNAEALVVDNGSTDGSLEWLASAYPQVRLLPQGRNLGYAGGMNAGLRVAQGELIAFLNNDVILRPDWLRRLAEVMADDGRIGVAGCKLLYPEGNLIQHAGGILRYPLALPDHYGFRQPDTGQFDGIKIKDVDYVTGAAFVARRELLDRIGAFDEGFYFYFEDTDLCFRARAAGWRVVVVPQAVAVHLESATAVRDSPSYYALFHRGRLRFVLKHYTPQQVLEDFLPAERARWPEGIAAAEREPLRQAYRETARNLDAILSHRTEDGGRRTEIHPATIERIRQGLYHLAALGASRPIEALIDALREHVFVSHVPVIGPLIGRFRALWNSVSTRWYVLPLAAQQTRLEDMQANLIALDRQLTALTRRMAIAERQLRPDGDQPLAGQGDVMRIAYFSPLPPQRSGISDYSAELLPYLAQGAEIELIVEDGFQPDAALASAFPVWSLTEFERRWQRYDVCLYQIGNNALHAYIYKALAAYPGVTVLHEVFLHHGIADSTAWRGDFAAYVREMGYSYGMEGVHIAQAVRRGERPYPLFTYPLNERVLDLSLGVIVHSAYARDHVLARRPHLYVAHIAQGVTLPPPVPEARARLGLPEEALIVSSFGLVTPEKQIGLALRAFAHLRARRPEAMYLIVGEVLATHPPLMPLIAELGLQESVRFTGRVPDLATFTMYIAATDIAINLRYPTVGETSGSLLRVMAGGVPAIVTDAGWYHELPEGTCLKLPPEADEAALAEALQTLADDANYRRQIGIAAREHIAQTHRWEDVANAYLAFIRDVLRR